jgi:hypothetical protein
VTRAHIIGACLMLIGCATQGDDFPALPPIADPQHGAVVAATAACGGPWREWSRTTLSSRWPFRVDVTETMRCLTDGRVVGPYSYRTDGL